MAKIPTWEEVRASFLDCADEHADVSADWNGQCWTLFCSPTGKDRERAGAECVQLFKESARNAVRILRRFNEPLPPYHVWLDMMRKEKRGFELMQFVYARDFRTFMESDASIDTSALPRIEDGNGSILHVFKESAEFCEDLAIRDGDSGVLAKNEGSGESCDRLAATDNSGIAVGTTMGPSHLEKIADPKTNAHLDPLWPLRLRAARAKATLSRAGAQKRLRAQGIQITVEAIKKHEEGARPKEDTRKAYAMIYNTPEGELFPD
jgi:hypothetical protein